MDSAATIILGTEIWMGIGAAVAVVFLLWGIDRVDEDAQGAYIFRPLLIPAILLIWPLVLWRWWALEAARDVPQARYRPKRVLHRWGILAMAVTMALFIIAGLAVRQEWPADIAPVRLDTQ